MISVWILREITASVDRSLGEQPLLALQAAVYFWPVPQSLAIHNIIMHAASERTDKTAWDMDDPPISTEESQIIPIVPDTFL